eukprot:3462467-Rhodomonas_salina.5
MQRLVVPYASSVPRFSRSKRIRAPYASSGPHFAHKRVRRFHHTRAQYRASHSTRIRAPYGMSVPGIAHGHTIRSRSTGHGLRQRFGGRKPIIRCPVTLAQYRTSRSKRVGHRPCQYWTWRSERVGHMR